VYQNFEKLHQQVEQYLQQESSGHDIYHADRVFNSALYIQSHEGGDEYIIGAAAIVHDICRPWEKKTGKSHFSPEALQIIRQVLTNSQVNLDKIEPVLEVVKRHDIYDWSDESSQKSIELQIVQDADNLDAIGAIGIARTFAFGGAHGSVMYYPGENLDFTNDFVEDPRHKTSTIAHFYEKLLKLKDHMNTGTGRRIAESRHQVMVDFLDQFFSEWEGTFT
jgi:uncharacterized protein